MSIVRAAIGAALGATAAGIALRVRAAIQREGLSIGDAVQALPVLLSDDIQRVKHAAEGAFVDGRRAQIAAEADIDQVLRAVRRTKEHHG